MFVINEGSFRAKRRDVFMTDHYDSSLGKQGISGIRSLGGR